MEGTIRFVVPLLGESEWPFRSESVIKEGQNATVIGFEEKVLLVKENKV